MRNRVSRIPIHNVGAYSRMDRSSSSAGAGPRGASARGGRRRQREWAGERQSTASKSAHARRGDGNGEEAGTDEEEGIVSVQAVGMHRECVGRKYVES